MRGFLSIVGIVVVLVLLITNSIIGGAFCVRGVGCLYSNGDGLRLDNSDVVQVRLQRTAP